MKYLSTFLVLFFLSNNVFADYVKKPFSLGLGTYVSIIDYADQSIAEDDFSGFSLSLGYTISNNFALRGTYFSLEHNDFSELESKGIDILAHFGTGLAKQGFKAYIGGGFFKDTIESSSFSENFSGLQLNGGIGYNWESVSLDLVLGIRDPSDYEDSVNAGSFTKTSAVAVSSTLMFSARF